MNNKSSIENSQSKIPDLWSGAQFTQINIVSQNTAKQFFFSYQPETTKKELRKINSFLQNKPNFRKSQMNVNKVLTRDYENARLQRRPKTNPIKPNTNPIQSQFHPKQTQSNPMRTRRSLRASFKESPNRGPISKAKKCNLTKQTKHG
jgi:hypothetical protein